MKRIDVLRERSVKYALEKIYLQEKVHEPKKGDTMSCLICKRKVHVLNNGKGPLTCCDQPMVKSTVPVTEGLMDKAKCKAAKYAIWDNKVALKQEMNYLSICLRGRGDTSRCPGIYKKKIDRYKNQIKMWEEKAKRYCSTNVKEAGFEDKPEGWTDKSIKKYSKTFTSRMKGNVKSKDFFDKCVKKMQGKVDNPEGFCAALKDEAHGSTYWRGKGKSPAKVKKDTARHKNV
jgi:desulfoferrodoxin-like iron-binding protein